MSERQNERPNEQHRRDGGGDPEGSLVDTLGRIGDRATPPTWNTIVDRLEHGGRRRRLPSPRDRRLWAVAIAGLVALAVVGSALRLGPSIFDGDTTEVDTIDAPEPPTSSTVPSEDATGVPTGCIDPDVVLAQRISLASGIGRANIDGLLDPNVSQDQGPGDDSVWIAGAVVDDGEAVVPTHIGVDVGFNTVITELEPGRAPRVDAPWPIGFDIDGDGAQELLLYEQANNFKRVDVYKLDGCEVRRVPIEGDARMVDGFPVEATSSACQDWCNVGLVCLPDGTLTSTESEPEDPADGRGDHLWTRMQWAFVDGALVSIDQEKGVAPFDDLADLGITNTVTCDVDQEPADPTALTHGDEALAVAAELGVDVLVGVVGDVLGLQGEGYVVVDGQVARHDDNFYRVVGVQGDALITAGRGSSIPEGPRYDFEGRPIECPPYAAFVDGTVADPEKMLAVDPVLQDDGGWALLMPNDAFSEPPASIEPLGFDALSEEWGAVPLWEVDCETGQRVRVPSTKGRLLPPAAWGPEVEIFMTIEHRGDRTWYFTGGEGFVTVLDGDGNVIIDTDMLSWQVSEDGSIIAAMDLDGVLRGFDAGTGEVVWTNDTATGAWGFRTFLAGDRMILASDIQPAAAVVSITTGETLVDLTTFENIRVLHAG